MHSTVLALSFVVGICGFQGLATDDYYELEENNPSRYRRNGCRIEDVVEFIAITELEDLVHSIAQKEHISPTSLLARLYQAIKNKQRMKDDDSINSLEDVAIQELVDFPLDLPPISNKIPVPPVLKPNFPFPSYPPPEPFLPFSKPPKSHQIPRILPPPVNPKMPPMFPVGDLPPKIPVPNMVPFIPYIRPLRPPPGVTVKINTGETEDIPDVTIAASPMMTVVEALQQANIKYQKAFGLSTNNDDDVISFGLSPVVGCYVVNRFDSIAMKKDLMWKITMLDKDGKIAYDGVCLPSGREIIVKSGMQISLTYTEIQ